MRSHLNYRFTRKWACALIIFLEVLGCAAGSKIFSTEEAPPSGFVENNTELAPWPERAAFLQRIWFRNRDEHYRTRSRFQRIMFRPTRIDFLQKPGWWTELNTFDQSTYQREVQEYAHYLDQQLIQAVQKDPLKRFEIATKGAPDVVIYEFAVTELVGTKVHVNLAGSALGAFVPGGGMVKQFGKGSVAVEVKAFDGANNEPLLAWVDREVDQASLFSFRDFTAYGHARKVARSWAENLIRVWNTPASHKVEGLSPFTLSPF